MMTPERKAAVIMPEKRKGSFNPARRWWDAICGGVIGAMITAVIIHVYNVSELRAYTSLVGDVIFVFSLIFLLVVGIIAANAHYNPPRELPELRQNPENSTVIQQWDGQEWQYALTILPADFKTSPAISPDLEKKKSSPARPSLLWIALVGVITSLYSLFLSRPPREK